MNEKITFNTCFRLVSFRRRNVFQARWMMPAACCLKRKQLFSQKWELCMKYHFSLNCYYFYLHSLLFLRWMSLTDLIHLRHLRCITLTAPCVYVSWKYMFFESHSFIFIFVTRLFLLPSCKKKANENTNFGGRRLGNLLWRQ